MASPRDLPSVDRLLQDPRVQRLIEREGHDLVVQAVRATLDEARGRLLEHSSKDGLNDLPALVAEQVERAVTLPLRPVINATGVLIHTNLGRAPLSRAALAAVDGAARGYSNLEYDLEAGERGSRHELVTDLLRRLTGAENALVVNNNAAAVLLALSALASGRQAVLSRGQLVEIGGGFRIPDVMRQSGVELVEVGTTNRTYPADYEAAIAEQTALLLRVHSSNFAQVGFTRATTLEELVAVGRAYNLPVVDDLGSGSLLDTSRYGLAREPMVQESLQAGAALVCFSGDKLLGGPQAGIIVGRADLMAQLRKHPLTRAVRPDKMAFAALGATLLHYLRGEAEQKVPVWRMISANLPSLEARARAIVERLGGRASVVEARATVGGGSLPGQELPSRAVALTGGSPDQLAASLRRGSPAIVARIEDGALLLDLRSVLPEEDDTLGRAVGAALAGS